MLEAHKERKARELHEHGLVTALAHHDPAGLKALDKSESKKLNLDELPAMLRIPKKKD